jgi:hypothetical protein
MKIAIISDIHDNLVNLEKCLSWCERNKIQRLVCCGDVTNSETLKFLSDNFKGIIYLVRGNMEIYDEVEVEQHNNIEYLGRIGKVELGGKIAGICHEPAYITKIISSSGRIGNKNDFADTESSVKISAGKPYLIDKLRESCCDVVFYGHTHKPWEERREGVKIVNPGTLGGMFAKATFAVWDSASGEAELKILELI